MTNKSERMGGGGRGGAKEARLAAPRNSGNPMLPSSSRSGVQKRRDVSVFPDEADVCRGRVPVEYFTGARREERFIGPE